MEGQYSGVDILEALESAHNYNDYLTRLIRESTESKNLIDFGAQSSASSLLAQATYIGPNFSTLGARKPRKSRVWLRQHWCFSRRGR